ncbi:MAG TPA: hypothetical protein DEO36_10360 [Flavobacteriaceae bacterium]|jgi:NitT/TauT family transport system substrate-binding protein|nr:hypothetical protein [Flavobacteriaceae bacterium]
MKKLKYIIPVLLIIGAIIYFNNRDDFELKKVKNTKENIVFAVPFAPVSYPIIKMIEDGTFDNDTLKSELILWKTPDQLRALVASKQADVFAVPSNVAATLYNKNIDVKLLNISIWRAMWLVSRSDDKKTLADFKGEEITMPFRGDMPHIVFMELAKKQGLDPEKDFKLNYVPSPMDAAKKMIMRRTDNALLIDPAVSMVIEKSKSGLSSVVAPDIYRSVDLQDEWGRLFNTENEIPIAGIMAGSDILKNPKLLKAFNTAYKKATEWCMEHPEETAKMVVKHIPQLNENAVTDAMKNVLLKSIDANEVRPKLEAFYKVLHKSKPELIGGKLPDDVFYFGNKKQTKATLKSSSVPGYMGFVLTNISDFNINEEQQKELLALKDNFKPKAMPINQKIVALAKTIKQKSLNRSDAKELEKLSKEFGILRIELDEIKTTCRDAVANVLTKEQWESLVEKYNKANPYEMGDPLGRMSPVPNYMIDVFHVDNLKLSKEQINQLANWSKDRHSNAVMAHSKIANLEKLIRQLSLEKKPKDEIVQKLKEMEKIRHKITVTKTVCRDFMKNDVLNKDQWDLLTKFITNKL